MAPAGAIAKRPPVVLISTVLVFANLVALFVELMAVLSYYDAHETTNYIVPQDIWGPFVMAIWAQAAVNGLILLPWRATRRIGVGFLIGTLVSVAALLIVIAAFLVPALRDS